MLPEKHYTDENGLPQNSVKFIAPGKNGYIWMGTENGVVRFDGKYFRIFNTVNLKLQSARINYLFSDQSLQLHAITEDEAVIDIGDGTATTRYWPWLTPASLLEHFLLNDRNNAFAASGLPNYFKGLVPLTEYLVPGNADTIYAIARNTITLQKGQHILEQVEFKYTDRLSFFFFEKELFYLDTCSGTLFGFDHLKPVPRQVTGDITTNKYWNTYRNKLQLYWNAAAGQLFFYLDNALYQVTQLPNGSFHTTLLLAGIDLKLMDIGSIYYNPTAARLFMGSRRYGLYTYTKKIFSTFAHGGADPVQYAQVHYGPNTVLTPAGNIHFADTTRKSIPMPALKNIFVSDKYNLEIDHRHHIWYKKDTRLYELDSACSSILNAYTFPSFITYIYADQHERLWIGKGNGELLYLKDGILHPYLQLPDRIAPLVMGKDGTLWIGTVKGLWYCPAGSRHAIRVPGLENKPIKSIKAVNTNEIWISTYGFGFYLFDGHRLTTFPLDKQNFLSVVHCVVPDEYGYIWLTTNKGLFQASKQDLLDYARWPEKYHLFYLYYARESGFNTNEFNGGCGPCSLTLEDGRISLPSMNGFVLLSPQQKLYDLPGKPLHLDAITVDGKTYSDYDTVWLQHQFKQLTVEFSTPYYGNDYNLQMEYALVTDYKDTAWLSVPDNHILAFSALPSGPHALLIRKLNGFGYGNYAYRNLVIMVAPAYYETAWFKILLVNLGLLLIFLYFSLRMYFLKKRNIELDQYAQTRTRELAASESKLREQMLMQEKLVAAISHDIKTPMRYLLYGAERMIDKELAADQMKEEAGIIYDTSYRMYFLLDNLISYIKTNLKGSTVDMEQIDLLYLVEEKIAIFAPIATTKQTTIHNEIPIGMLVRSNLMILGIIIHNLLDNAVKHTVDGDIRLAATTRGQRVHITISDTGDGFQPEVLAWLQREAGLEDASLSATKLIPYGIGLAMVLELIRLLKGQLYVQSIPGKGASLTISIAI